MKITKFESEMEKIHGFAHKTILTSNEKCK